jgi:hypothetical protein
MRDIYLVLREKELEVVRVRQEIDALRAIIPLLADDDEEPPATPIYPLRAISRD